MMLAIKKKFILFVINLSIFVIFIGVIELIFGYWLKNNNFGIYMRSERNKVVKFSVNHHNNKKIDFIHKRNFYGFIGNDFDPSDVKVIFEGGSTGAEIWKPQEASIVENLNSLLSLDNIDKKIYNASVNGKSIRGYIYDFNHWFKRIPNFNPDYVIFYLGINDRKFPDDEIHRFFDQQHSTNFTKKIRDYIKNNSFFLEKIKKIENKYFPKNKIMYNKNKENLYNNFEYINYKNAKKLFSDNYNDKDIIYLQALKLRLKNLNKVIIDKKIIPIFITQIKFDGLSEKRLFLANEEVKKFAKKNNYKIIPLDELIDKIEKGDFFDEYHTTISGSKKIALKIYEYLEF
jgi:lysophospholipase L1-like esterase